MNKGRGADSPASRPGPRSPSVLPARLRRVAWRRWAVGVLVLNIALGSGVSVVALRHQADARAHAAVLLADLDAAVSGEQALLLGALATGTTDEPGTLDAAHDRVGDAAAALATGPGLGGVDDGIAEDVAGYGTVADQLRTALALGDLGSAGTAADRLAPAAARLRSTLATVAEARRADDTSAGRVADIETVFLMLFAAAVAALLFRRSEAARRTGEQRVAAAKARSEARFRALVQSSSDVITLTDAASVVAFQTPSVTRLLGYRPEELVGTRLVDLAHPADRLALLAAQDEAVGRAAGDVVSEVRLRHRDGTWRHVQSVHADLLAVPHVRAVVITTRDVTAQKELEAQLQHNAFHDTLTGLANRALFSDRLQHALDRSDRAASSVAVLFVDLDDFKAVNDGAGHTAGDALLAAVAGRLQQALRPGDTVARLGGDEFAVLLEQLGSPAVAQATADRLLEALADPFDLDADSGTGSVRVTASLGIAVGAAGLHDAAELLRDADVAMYAAKAAGKGRSAVFAPDMDSAILGQLRLKSELAGAVERGEFTVHYQPTVDLRTGRLAGVEALVRWEHPDRGLVPPLDFVPLAEQTGLIVPIGRFVLREACHQMSRWQAAHPELPPLTVSVNLSARELEEPGLVPSVHAALADSGLDPRQLVLEITETLLMVDVEQTVGTLHQLRALGLRLAVDDFGTGYSSLSYLEDLPVDILKIDKSFVDRIADQPTDPRGAEAPGRDGVMVAAISQLGHSLDLQLVAEGIEHAEQVATLSTLSCQYGQGYYFARPLTADAFAAMLDAQEPAPRWALEPTAGDVELLAGSSGAAAPLGR